MEDTFDRRQPVYSRSWAQGVVQEIKNKYPRGTEILCNLLVVTEHHLGTFLVYNDPEWANIRKVIKILDSWALKGWDMPKKGTPDYYTYVRMLTHGKTNYLSQRMVALLDKRGELRQI